MEFQANFREDLPLLSGLFPEKPIKPEFPTMIPLQSSQMLNNHNNCNGTLNTFQHFLQHPITFVNVSNPSFMMEGSSSSNPFSGMPQTTALSGAYPFKQAYTNGSLRDFSRADCHIPQFAPNNNIGTLHGYPSQPSTTPLWDLSKKIPAPPFPIQSSLSLSLYQPPLYNEDYQSDLKYWLHDEFSAFINTHGWGESIDQKAEDKKRTRLQRRKASKPERTSSFIRGQWTPEEDMILAQLVEKFGPKKKWSQIAKLLRGRVGKQCRERWHNHLQPDIRKEGWTEEEDMVLIEAHKEIGNKWVEIARRLPGRTENTVKNHWNATKRRQNSKKLKNNPTTSKSTLLQEYINMVTAAEAAAKQKEMVAVNSLHRP